MPLPPDNLSDYLAVPGRIIPIPGTDYVVIAPDWEKYKARWVQYSSSPSDIR